MVLLARVVGVVLRLTRCGGPNDGKRERVQVVRSRDRPRACAVRNVWVTTMSGKSYAVAITVVPSAL